MHTQLCSIVNSCLVLIFIFYRFANFLHIVAPSDEMFDIMVPEVYWSVENLDLEEELKEYLIKNCPRDCKNRKTSFKKSCDKIKRLVNGKLYYIEHFYCMSFCL